MAIKKNFGGATIRKPGAYSQSKVSPDAGTATIATDTLLLIGEADAGEGGSEDGIQIFSAAAFNRLKAKYRSGPIVDCAKASLIPSKTPGIGGAGRIAVWKTNASVQASLALANSYGTVKALEYGIGGNQINFKATLAAEVAPTISGSAAVTNFGGLDGLTLIVRKNGGASETVTFSSPADMAAVLSQINAGLTDITATEDSAVLILTNDAIANHHRDGWGQSLEIVGGTALGDLFLTAGTIAVCETENQSSLVATQTRDAEVESDTVGGVIALQIGRDDSDSATAATVTIDSDDVTLTATGSSTVTLSKTEFPTIGKLVDAINIQAGWIASAPATLKVNSVETLDEVVAIGAFSEAGNKPARIKNDASEVAEFFSNSSLVEIASQLELGLPDNLATTNLTGGSRGASASSDFDAGLSAALAEDVNVILPCISQDASVDAAAGLTDASSTYDIETIHAALDTHLRLRGSIKNRKEAQGMCGYRKALKADVYEQAATVQSELVQLAMLDVYVIDAATNVLAWKQPHVFAALTAGMRLGSDVGEPLTHKYLNCSGIGHYVNTSTGKVEGDFDPQIDYDEAIDAGVLFAEPASGGFRIVVDNTTYGQDESFVFNRGSVMEAAQYAAKFIRTDAELAFVGRKTSVINAASIKSRIRTRLISLFEDEILTASDDAPQGFVEETFIVEVTGNTAEVQVEIKPVQGLDFVFITFTLGDTTQSA